MYETEGIALQAEHLGRLLGAFTTDIGALSTYTTLWGYDSYAERERAARSSRRPTWQEFLATSSRCCTPSRTASWSRRPSRRSADGPLDGKVASSRVRRRGSAVRSPTGSPRKARASSSPTCTAPRKRRPRYRRRRDHRRRLERGGVAAPGRRDGRAAAAASTSSSTTPASTRRSRCGRSSRSRSTSGGR